MSIITSLLDTDLYKLTMLKAVENNFPGAQMEYKFKCRTKGVDLSSLIVPIWKEVTSLCNLRFTFDELDYLKRKF